MRKQYNAPVVSLVDIEISAVMKVASLPTKEENTTNTVDRWFSTGSAAEENIGGSWENIWNE